MPRKLVVFGWLLAFGHALGVGGCIYDTPRLDMPPGGGDASLGDVRHADSDCLLRPDSTCNHAPVAKINRGAAEFQVGSNTSVVLTGRGSEDQDGDELSYLWELSGGCTNDVGAEHTEETFTIWTLAASEASACLIKLTVSDGLATDTAKATVTVLEVGALVRNMPESSCAVLGADFSDVLGKGTTALPWCSVADAVAVAEHFSLHDVGVAAGTYSEASLIVPANINISGGLNADFGEDQYIIPNIVVSGPVGVTLEPGGAHNLSRLAIRFAEPCIEARCVLLQLSGSEVQIDNCYLGTDALLTEKLAAPGKEIVVVEALGPGFDLTLAYTHVELPSAADVAIGLRLAGECNSRAAVMAGNISGHVEGAGVLAGIESADLAELTLASAAQITIMSGLTTPVGQISQAYGVHDGLLAAESPTACDGQLVCQGSAQVTIESAMVQTWNQASTGGDAVAVALYGTGVGYLKTHEYFESIWLRADANGEAVGLHTVATEQIYLEQYTGGNVSLETGMYSPPLRQAAVLDGLVDLSVGGSFGAVADSGSQNFLMVRVRLKNNPKWFELPPTQRSYSAAAIWATSQNVQMLGVNDVNVADGSLVLETGMQPKANDGVDAYAPEVMAGIWMLGANNVEVRGVTLQSPTRNLMGARIAAAVLDGDVAAANTPVAGSSDVRLLDSYFDVRFADFRNTDMAPATARVACVLLNGTQRGKIGTQDLPEQSFACHNTGRTTAEPPTHDIWLLATREIVVHNNLLGIAGTMTDTGTLILGSHVALRDGQGEIDDELPEPSDFLTISYNRVAPRDRQFYQSDIGIFLDHGSRLTSSPEPAEIYNNVVFAVPAKIPNGDNTTTSRVVGVRLMGAKPWLVHNTLHGGLCDSTSTTDCAHLDETVALFMVAPDDASFPTLVNNIFSVGDGMVAIAVLDNRALLNDGTLNLGATFHHNVLVDTRLMGRTPNYFCAYSVADGNQACFENDALLVSLGLQGSAYTTDWPFCPSDNVHLGGASDDANLIIDQGSVEILLPAQDDFEGEARVGVPDIGADEKAINAVCP